MNALYDNGRQAFLEGRVAWVKDTIRAAIVQIDAGHYVCKLAEDDTLASIPEGSIVAISEPLQGKAAHAGVASCPQARFKAVSGAPGGALVLFKDGGSPAASPLICYLDTGPGIPITPAGGPVSIEWDERPIFRI